MRDWKRNLIIFVLLVITILIVRLYLVNSPVWFASVLNKMEDNNGNVFYLPASSLVDVKVNGNNGPIKLKAPATYLVEWAIDPKLAGADCSLTGYNEDELVKSISGSGGMTIQDVDGGITYYYTVECTLNNQMEYDRIQVVIE